jgi:hypothetical protein
MTDLHERMKAAGGGLPPSPFTIDDLTSAGRRRVRRRRWLVSAASAATAVVAVTATATILGTPARTPTVDPAVVEPAAPASAFTVTFAGYRSGALRVADPEVVTPGYVAAGIFRDDRQVGILTAYRPGVFRPVAGGEPAPVVDVAGKKAMSYSNEQVLGANRIGAVEWGAISVSVLAWKVAAPDTWATIDTFGKFAGVTPDETRALAAAFKPVDGSAARLPYRMGHLPSGFKLVQAGTWGRLVNANDAVLSGSVYHRAAPAFAGMTGLAEFEGPSSTALLISVAKSDRDGPQKHPIQQKCLAATRHSGVICEKAIKGAGFDVRVDDRSRTLPVAEVERIVDSIQPADLGKPATWIPAA